MSESPSPARWLAGAIAALLAAVAVWGFVEWRSAPPPPPPVALPAPSTRP